jgi:CubicO group peptidase (beta-lactamase class C family)
MGNRSTTSENEPRSFIIGKNAFGHIGIGGSCGFADPDHEISFGYLIKRMASGFYLAGVAKGF